MKRQRRRYLRLTSAPRKYASKEARDLREFTLTHVLPHAAHKRHWQRGLRWLEEFEGWARPFLRGEAARLGAPAVVQTLQEYLEDDELCRLFISSLLRKRVAFSVPRAARRYLSDARKRLGLPSLVNDVALSDLIRGYERSMPRTVVQALSLQVDDAQRITTQWGGVSGLVEGPTGSSGVPGLCGHPADGRAAAP